MNDFLGGSLKRFVPPMVPGVIYTEGAMAVADVAGAYWLMDVLGLECAPRYAEAFKQGRTSVGCLQLHVDKDGTGNLTLVLEDDQPPAWEQSLDATDFPPGDWQFYLGTDELPSGELVTVVLLPQEY